MTKRAPWTDQENAALVALYFAMLDEAIAGRPYNKAAMIRQFRGEHQDRHNLELSDYVGPLRNRSRGSIEAKLMNASAAHRDCYLCSDGDLGEPETMDGHGYRALPNYQKSLKDAMKAALLSREFRGAETEIFSDATGGHYNG